MDELDLRFEMIFKKINRYISKVEDLNMITKAYYFAKLKHDGINRIGGGPYMTHLLETADILVDLNAGPATIASGLLHDTVEDVEGVTNELIEVLFGKDISTLVDSLTKVNMAEVDKQSEKNYTIKKIFNAMGKDVRTIIVKLADRLSNMRSLEKVSQEHKLRVSKQTLEIYAPVARSIGFNKIGNELEELCLFYLDNARYHEIKNYIEDNLSKTSQIIQDTKENIENALSSLNIKSRLYVTTKDIYSIYKFLNNNKKFDEIDDLNVILYSTK